MNKFRLYVILYLYNIIWFKFKKKINLLTTFTILLKKYITILCIIQLGSLFKVNVFFILKTKKNKRSEISIVTNNANFSTSINRKFMIFEIQVDSTLLNNSYLIH